MSAVAPTIARPTSATSVMTTTVMTAATRAMCLIASGVCRSPCRYYDMWAHKKERRDNTAQNAGPFVFGSGDAAYATVRVAIVEVVDDADE